jgi:hypothetical protein
VASGRHHRDFRPRHAALAAAELLPRLVPSRSSLETTLVHRQAQRQGRGSKKGRMSRFMRPLRCDRWAASLEPWGRQRALGLNNFRGALRGGFSRGQCARADAKAGARPTWPRRRGEHQGRIEGEPVPAEGVCRPAPSRRSSQGLPPGRMNGHAPDEHWPWSPPTCTFEAPSAA